MKKLISLLLILTQLPISALATLSEADHIHLGLMPNQATNGGAESGKYGWTVSGTSAVIGDLVVDTTNKFSGNAGFAWTPHNADNYLTNTAVTITSNQGLSGRNCAARVWTKTASALKTMEAYDGTNVLASVTIPASTTFQPVTLNFPCSASGTNTIRFNAASTTVLYFDSLSWGDAAGINVSNVSQAQLWGSIVIDCTSGSGSWSITSTSMAAIPVATGCTYTVTGNASAPSTMLPGLKFASLPPGDYLVTTQSWFNSGGNGVAFKTRLSDGTNYGREISYYNTGTGGSTYFGGPTYSINYTTAQSNITLQLYASVSSGTGSIGASTASTTFSMNVYYFPSQSQTGYRADQTPASWSGYHNNDCAWTTTSGSYVDPSADATCTFVQNTNSNFGTVTSNGTAPGTGSYTPSITFTPSRAGKYFACAIISAYDSTVGNTNSFKLTDGTNVISAQSHRTAVANYNQSNTLCGIVPVTSTAAVTLKVQIATSAANTLSLDSQGGLAHAIDWSIVQVDAGSAMPLLVGAKVTNSSGITKDLTAILNCDAGSAITSQSGSTSEGVATIGNISSGVCAGTFAGTGWTSAPTCTANIKGSTLDTNARIDATSSTAFNLYCITPSTGAALSTCDVSVSCSGPR